MTYNVFGETLSLTQSINQSLRAVWTHCKNRVFAAEDTNIACRHCSVVCTDAFL